MTSVLHRPRRPLPRQFRRRVSPQTRSFVKRRHARAKNRGLERLRRTMRRTGAALRDWLVFMRRWSLLGIAVFVIGIMGLALFSPLFEIREISIQRTQSRVDVRQVIKTLTPLYGEHLMFVGASDITARLTEVIPDLDKVIVRKAYPHKLVVRVTVQPVVAKLQIEGSRAAASSSSVAASGSGAGFFGDGTAVAPVQTYDYLTENGVYISTPSVQSGSNLLTLRIVDWAVRPVPNTPLLAPDFLQRIRETEAALSDQFGQKTRSRTVYVRAQEYHLDMGGFTLWFDRKGSLADHLARYRIFLQEIGLKEVKQYVDLRLNSRVVYR